MCRNCEQHSVVFGGLGGDRTTRNADKYGRRMLFHMDKLRWGQHENENGGIECHLMASGKYGISRYAFGPLGMSGALPDSERQL